jgi:Plasmid pRiA4b ORF-3-like protein
VVLIDYLLGGGIKDIRVDSYAETLRKNFQQMARDPDLVFSDLAPAEARTILVQALARPPCPVEPDQIEAVEASIDLLRARVAAMAGVIGASGGANKAPIPAKAPAPRRKAPPPRNTHRVKVTLRGAKPPIWRRLEVPSDISLERLHRVIQMAFEWEDDHLHVFETSAGLYGVVGEDALDGIKNDAYKKLSTVADWPGDHLRYVYDFGDNWELDIVVEAVSPAEPGVRYPRCTGGRRASPPEDSGGVWGYAEMLNILANPRHSDHVTWLGRLGIESAADYDPAVFDPEIVNLDLAQISRVLVKP